MKPFSFSPTREQVALVRSFVAAVAAGAARMDATDHPLERAALGDEIAALICPGNDNAIVNLAGEFSDAKTTGAIAEFVALTRSFYVDELRAKKSAEASDLIVSLLHQRNSFGETPTVDRARQLAGFLQEFLDSPAAVDSMPNDDSSAQSEPALAIDSPEA